MSNSSTGGGRLGGVGFVTVLDFRFKKAAGGMFSAFETSLRVVAIVLTGVFRISYATEVTDE